MDWTDATDENPGFFVYYYDDPDNPGHRYVIQKRKDGTGTWRLAFRANEDDALRIILVAPTQAECKAYAEAFMEQAR